MNSDGNIDAPPPRNSADVITQNENADTVIVLQSNVNEGLCWSLAQAGYLLLLCREKGYYFIVDNEKFGSFKFTDIFKPFWDERLNQKMLATAKKIYVVQKYLLPPSEGMDKSRVEKKHISDFLGFKMKRTKGSFQPMGGLYQQIYQLRDDVRERANALRQSIFSMTEKYQAIHIRRGDRVDDIFEVTPDKQLPSVSRFLQALDPDIPDVYVATDDITVMKEIRKLTKTNTRHRFYSSIDKNKNPHVAIFSGSNRHQQLPQSLFYLLADIDICVNADQFVGGDRTNLTRVVNDIRQEMGKLFSPVMGLQDVRWFILQWRKFKRVRDTLLEKIKRLLRRGR